MLAQESPLSSDERKRLLDSKYPPLKPMKPGSDRGMFGDGVASHNSPLVTRAAKEVLPGIRSTDPAFLKFLRSLADGLDAACPVDLDREKFTRTGIHQAFSSLKTVAGWMMNPMSYVAVDNADYIKHLGLRAELSAIEKQVGEELWDIIWEEYVPSKIKVAKMSQSGPRRNTHDHEWKKAFGEYVLQQDVLEEILQLHEAKDYIGLANKFEMLWIMYSQKRDQPDTAGKNREVMDLEYARSGGVGGHIKNADKTVVIDGVSYPDFSCTRARFIHAGPWAINVILSMISTGTMQSMFLRFPDVFHVNTAEQVKTLVDGHYIYAGDVKEYDRSMKSESIRIAHERCKKVWDHRLVDMSEHLYFSSYYAKPLSLDGLDGGSVIIGDYTSFEPQVECGNRSGHAWTSLIAKVNKVWETLYVFHLCGIKVLGNVRNILLGRSDLKLINNGDDEVIYTKSKATMKRFEEVRSDVTKGGYVVAREDGQVYSGMVIRLVDEVNLVYEPCPRLATGFAKIYVPERSIGGLMRPFWYIGVAQRVNERDAHPMAEKAWEVHDKLYHDMLAPTYGGMYEMLTHHMRQGAKINALLSEADKEVLDDPSKLYYKYAEGDIHPEVVKLSTIHVAIESAAKSIKTYYTGSVEDRINSRAANHDSFRRYA